jgi:hypothetical protein
MNIPGDAILTSSYPVFHLCANFNANGAKIGLPLQRMKKFEQAKRQTKTPTYL